MLSVLPKCREDGDEGNAIVCKSPDMFATDASAIFTEAILSIDIIIGDVSEATRYVPG